MSDGKVYEGEFIDDQFHGKGKLTMKDGSYYDGNWEKNKQNGKGIKKNSNGRF